VNEVQNVLGHALVVIGTALIFGATVGIIRLPDLYNRTNAVAKAAALGVSLILAGVAVLRPSLTTVLILVLAIAAQLFTAPIAGYAVARAGYRSGVTMSPKTHRDDLAELYRAGRAERPSGS
jgi:multicomponent Na+:H+ antiporter subunit G